MNIKQLEVFIAVAESGSFSRAAELTNITQSTVSQHISSLESEYGLKLLDRTGKGALLTEAGKLLLYHARRLTSEAREIPLIINRFKGMEDTVLRLGGSNIPACYLIPQLIHPFRRTNPGVTILLLQGDSRETVDRLIREDCELAIIGSRYEGEDLVYTPLTIDKLSLAVNSDHRWKTTEMVGLDELASEPFLFREAGSGTARTVCAALKTSGLDEGRFKVKTYLGSNEAVKQAILAGVGVSFISELSVRKECERGDVHLVKVNGLDIVRTIYVVSRQGRELSPAALSFASFIRGNLHPHAKDRGNWALASWSKPVA